MLWRVLSFLKQEQARGVPVQVYYEAGTPQCLAVALPDRYIVLSARQNCSTVASGAFVLSEKTGQAVGFEGAPATVADSLLRKQSEGFTNFMSEDGFAICARGIQGWSQLGQVFQGTAAQLSLNRTMKDYMKTLQGWVGSYTHLCCHVVGPRALRGHLIYRFFLGFSLLWGLGGWGVGGRGNKVLCFTFFLSALFEDEDLLC